MPALLISRRKFLKTNLLALAGLAISRLASAARQQPIATGRVTVALIYIYEQPDFSSKRVGQKSRDHLLELLEEVQSPKGPAHNPLWYRIASGYVHSGYVQRVPFRPTNRPLESIPKGGVLGEVTVPYTRTFFEPKGEKLRPLYRLYYESVHWIVDVCDFYDDRPWYCLSDPKNDSRYYVPADDLRPIPPEEYSPIARDVPADSKRILVSLEEQTLTAFEGDRIAMTTSIASGRPSPDLPPDEIPTDTPTGYFWIQQKMASRHMGDGRLTSQVDAYELPGVPWTMAFHETGAAMHGSYWHNNFGRRMSHGCINMRNSDALWLFRWSDPVFDLSNWYTNGLGTRIQIV